MKYEQETLREIFNEICPADWKGPIAAVMTGELVLAAVEAIKFFTGTSPEVRLNVKTMQYVVTSEGYRKGPCGDR